MNKYSCAVFKRSIPVVFIILFLGTQAQSKVRFGLHTAPSINWLRSSSGYWTYDAPRFGIKYGLGTEIFFSDNYALSFEVDYANTGGKLSNNTAFQYLTSSSINTTYKLQYLELPIGLKLKTNEIGYFSYFGKFSAVPALILDGTAQYDTKDLSSSGVQTQFFKNGSALSQMRTTNLALRIGLGAEYNFSGKSSFLVGIHFTKGMTSAMNNVTFGATVIPNKTFLNSVGVDLGILF